MNKMKYIPRRGRLGLGAGVTAAALGAFAVSAGAADPDKTVDKIQTTTPIKHVIVVLAENSSFDHSFGTYQPRNGQRIHNLLSTGIVNADGTPGPNFKRAAQFTVAAQTGANPKYFIDAPDLAKTPYTTLPPPDLRGVPLASSDTNAPPFATAAAAQAAEPSLEPEDVHLLTTGAAVGLTFTPETSLTTRNPDTRIANVLNLPNGPYQQTAKDASGHGLPYDAYTEDTIHRFYQMWQQSDCSVRHATQDNPTGCLADLLPYVITTFAGAAEEGMGTSMAFFNMNQGDAPVLKKLAQEFSIADNYHQAVMGGTGAQHIMIGTGDVYFFNNNFFKNGGANGPLDFTPEAPVPAPGAVLGLPPSVSISLVANPDPIPGTNNVYRNDVAAALGEYVNCSDQNQPGVPAITSYLATLPYKTSTVTTCAPNTFYAINNFFPGYHADGTPANPLSPHQAADGSDFFIIPPQNVPTIGDALIAKNVPWVYYGGGFNDAVAGKPNAFCPICNPMQYAASIYGDKNLIKQHTKDIVDFFADVNADTLPAVSFVKPSGFVDGHPQSSKLNLFEALLDNIVDQVRAKPELFAETAIIVTWDESGGFYDSGFIQPVDFFGDGPRVPLLVISPFARGGNVVHTYYDHVSITKFIERNWGLKPLSTRSRDNLPNPVTDKDDNPYVPRNMPAIGDLMDMFHFDGDGHGDRADDDSRDRNG
jgi:phospholipase C